METRNIAWQPDILGADFQQAQFSLPDDAEGAVVTTLIRYAPATPAWKESAALGTAAALSPGVENASTGNAITKNAIMENASAENADAGNFCSHSFQPRTPFAFLALHGWNDYFYQRELARAIAALGGYFYALDLRKYGRSYLPGQSWGYISDLSEYDAELHVALDVIQQEHGSHIPIVLYGHSTGGLTAALWADRHPGVLAALVLNSPWLELQGTTNKRLAGQGAIDALARVAPTRIIPLSDNGFYHRTLTGHHLSEVPAAELPADAGSDPFFTTGWQPNENWRNTTNFQVRSAWFNAILAGHRRVASGLAITAPTLVLTSARSVTAEEWTPAMLAADSVLTVTNIWKRVPTLGTAVTLIKLEGAIHDVTLSRRAVREKAFCEIGRFLTAWC